MKEEIYCAVCTQITQETFFEGYLPSLLGHHFLPVDDSDIVLELIEYLEESGFHRVLNDQIENSFYSTLKDRFKWIFRKKGEKKKIEDLLLLPESNIQVYYRVSEEERNSLSDYSNDHPLHSDYPMYQTICLDVKWKDLRILFSDLLQLELSESHCCVIIEYLYSEGTISSFVDELQWRLDEGNLYSLHGYKIQKRVK